LTLAPKFRFLSQQCPPCDRIGVAGGKVGRQLDCVGGGGQLGRREDHRLAAAWRVHHALDRRRVDGKHIVGHGGRTDRVQQAVRVRVAPGRVGQAGEPATDGLWRDVAQADLAERLQRPGENIAEV